MSEFSLLEDASLGQGSEDGVENLTKAFELFSQETKRLEKAYRSLKKRLDTVNVELEESNKKLNQKVQELDTVTNYLDSILAHMKQGIVFIGISGKVTTFNKAAEKMLGLKRKEVLLTNYLDHFDDLFFGFSISQVLESQSDSLGMLIKETNDKEIEITPTFVGHGPQSNRGIILLLRDVSEIRRLQRITNRSDRLKELGEMAASVAHEIRNPLGGIEGFASLLARDLEGDEKQQDMAQQIVQGTRELNSLVSKVLNYARPLQLCCESVDLIPFLESIVSFLKVDKKIAGKICFSFNSSIQRFFVFVDPLMLRSAIFNLLLNAAEAMPRGGEVKVLLKKYKSQAILEIIDNGKGIAKENLEKIFSPFFTTKHSGNGFGLSEVYKVLQAHGASIEVFSELGQGSRFVIKIAAQ